MRRSVREVWLGFTEGFEGGIPYLYNDIRGMTTVAFGNLVDSVGAVLDLPFMHPGGVPATKADIAAAWQSVHNDPQAAPRGHTYAKKLTTIRLTREGMEAMAYRRLDANHADLVKLVPDIDDLPACIAIALHSVMWACGSRSPFPRLYSAVNARNWDVAAIEIHMNEWTKGPNGERILNSGLVPRNVANKILVRNGGRIHDFKLDPDLIEWGKDLSVSSAPTLPALDNPASQPALGPRPLPEEVTGSGPIVHPLAYPLEVDPTDGDPTA